VAESPERVPPCGTVQCAAGQPPRAHRPPDYRKQRQPSSVRRRSLAPHALPPQAHRPPAALPSHGSTSRAQAPTQRTDLVDSAKRFRPRSYRGSPSSIHRRSLTHHTQSPRSPPFPAALPSSASPHTNTQQHNTRSSTAPATNASPPPAPDPAAAPAAAAAAPPSQSQHNYSTYGEA